MKEIHRGCVAEIGSLTQAMRAQKILASAVIPTTVLKLESSSRHGCAYGITFSCEQETNVRHVLDSARMAVKQWQKND